MVEGKNEDGVRLALARAVAGRKVDLKQVQAVAARLDNVDYKIRGINPCIYGICLDFFLERPEIDGLLGKLGETGRIRGIRVFPWGIPWPDIYHVIVEQQFDEIPDAPMPERGLAGMPGEFGVQ